MPSPFPGMDPYLEDPIGWPDVHLRLIAALSDDLAATVSPHFYVRIEERVYVTHPEDDPGYPALIPDVVVTTGRSDPLREKVLPSGAVITAPVLVDVLLEPEIHDRYIEVRDARSHEVVAAIEVLSAANKVKGSRGRDALVAKRSVLRRAGAHWIEIDLLRGGERPEAVAGRSDYIVLLMETGVPQTQARSIDIRDRLPTIGVPLRPPFGQAALDLQDVLDIVYDRARYADSVDYSRPVPAPRLKPADAAWVRGVVEQWLAPRAGA